MDSIWRYGGCMMNINWGMLGIMIGTMIVWWSVFQNGFFITLISLIIVGCIGGIIIKLREDTRV